MGFRRFQNFQIGALTAQRLNSMQDAIARLQAKVDGMSGAGEEVRRTILARVTATGVKSGFDNCTGAVPSVSYRFSEVFLQIATTGDITATTCVKTEMPDDAITSSRGAYLLKFEDEPSLKVGDVVVAYLAPFTSNGNAEDKQQVYIASSAIAGGEGELRLCTLTEALSDHKYKGTLNGDNQEVEIENLYESQGYYGAASVTLECASVVAGERLPIGSEVWAMKVGGTGDRARIWVTMTPTPFGVECTCGELGQPLQLMGEGRDANAIAAGIVSRMTGGIA